MSTTNTGTANAIVEAVVRRGIDTAFCVPGESYLAAMDAFYGRDDVELIATRHEEGAGLAAEAYAKISGKTGVCFVTRGPGLTHLAIALHTAFQDSTPLVAIVGQVPTEVRHRESFQEMDILAYSRPMAKWAVEVGRGDRAEEIIERAFAVAESGRPGPVVVSLPEDVDRELTDYAPWKAAQRAEQRASDEAIAEMTDMLAAAERPVIIAGTSGQHRVGHEPLLAFAEQLGAPVYTAWRRPDAFPNDHALYRGTMPTQPKELFSSLREADVIVAVGTRLDEYSTLDYSVPAPHQRMIQIDVSAADFSMPNASYSVAADPGPTLRALAEALAARGHDGQAWDGDAGEQYVRQVTPQARPEGAMGLVHPEGIYHDLRERFGGDVITTSDAGTFGGWLMRFQRWTRPQTFAGPTAGGMGYALPAAIGAKTANPDLPVVAFAGDGGYTMTFSEIETAVRMGLEKFVVLVFNNSLYGTIRKHQNREFPGRAVATDLGTIDFAAVAEAMGAWGATVTDNKSFASTLEAALESGKPAVIDIRIHPEFLDPWGEKK